MGRSIVTKILQRALKSGSVVPGEDLAVDVDQILIEDATGTMAAMQFEMLGVDRIGVDLGVMYVDHNVLQVDDKNMQDHRYLRSFCARYGLHYSPPGNGISHYLHLEQFSTPGKVLIGADSHTSTAGAVGSLAIGAGGLEVATAMAGFGFGFVAPTVVGVTLTGALRPESGAKDIVLELLRRYDVRGGRGCIFEFTGEGTSSLSVTERASICNMIIETGATTGIFPSDAQTEEWMRLQGRPQDYSPLRADDDAVYDEQVEIALDEIVPLVAIPHSPGNVIPVSEAPLIPLVQVCVGSSVNSSYDDLATVAAIVRGKKLAPGIQMTVTPGSRAILESIITSGVYEDLMMAGARILEPICGPCVGIGQAPIAAGASLRTFNRNFPGRSGTAEDTVLLCSPQTAAASALAGRIVPASELPEKRPYAPLTEESRAALRDLTMTPPAGGDPGVEIERGPNLVPPSELGPLPERLSGDVIAVVGDDISTGDMAPDGVIAMSVWSNIAACAPFMFSRVDPGFYERAQAAGRGFIVGGHNYGQGSSREHAALIPASLGVRAIVAKSFARIHRRNLIAVGIVPLLLPETSVEIQVGDVWTIEGVRSALAAGAKELDVVSRASGRLTLKVELSDAERRTLVAGGLLADLRNTNATPDV